MHSNTPHKGLLYKIFNIDGKNVYFDSRSYAIHNSSDI